MKQYNYVEYWNQRGKEPVEKWTIEKQLNTLSALYSLKFNSVLEFGAGDGELTNLILDNFTVKDYTGLDISETRLDLILDRINLDKFCFDVLDFETTTKYDLVVCSHFLLHIEPKNIKKVIDKMVRFSKKYVIVIEPIHISTPGKWAYYNFPHNYFKLFESFDEKKFYLVENNNVGLWLIKLNPS